MIRLRILGPPDIADPIGGDAERLLQQPKRFALLAYLAMASRTQPVSRDTLVSMFWPEFETERARHALRQSLHQIRSLLGGDAIQQHGLELLRLNPRRVSCDAAVLLNAIDKNEISDAVLRLYRGSFLDGFLVPGIPGFKGWAEAERAELRAAVAKAASNAAAAFVERGERAEAIACLQHALRINPGDETRLRELMMQLSHAGDSGGAVATYEAFARRLALEHERTPSSETEDLAAGMRSSDSHSIVWHWTHDPIDRRRVSWFAVMTVLFVLIALGTGALNRPIATVMALRSGEDKERLPSLERASPRALRAFLEGEEYFRAGQYEAAAAAYTRALDHDSTFALAGLGAASAATAKRLDGDPTNGRPIALAWAGRETLGVRDRALLTGYAGPNYPEVPTKSETLRAWQHAVEVAPERADAWSQLGDCLLHWGPVLEITNSTDKAEQAFRHAIDLQPSLRAPLAHLVELTAARGALDDSRRFLSTLQNREPRNELLVYLKWRWSMAAHDNSGLNAVRGQFDSAAAGSLERIISTTTVQNYPAADAERSAAILEQRSGGTYALEPAMVLHDYAMARGEPDRARDVTDRFSNVDGQARYDLQTRVLDALYDEGDQAIAAQAVDQLAELSRVPLASEPDLFAAQLQNRCILEQWRLLHRDTTSYAATVKLLRSERTRLHFPGFAGADAVCSGMLEILAARISGRALRNRLEELEDLMLQGPPHAPGAAVPSAIYANLLIARVWDELGERPRALRAAERRPNHWYFGNEMLNGYRAEERRLRSQVALTVQQPVDPALASGR